MHGNSNINFQGVVYHSSLEGGGLSPPTPQSPVTKFPSDYVACGIQSSECYVRVNDASDFWNVLKSCQRNIWFVKLPKNVLLFFLNAEAFFFSEC